MANNPSFIALMNKTGIACAASDDFTIHKISSKEPLVIAVNPQSKIPWENIINKYKRPGELKLQETLLDYANAFLDFLIRDKDVRKCLKAVSEESKIIFLGYGCNDVYPSSLTLRLSFREQGIDSVEIVMDETVTIDAKHETAIRMMGNFDRIAPVLYGPSPTFLNAYKRIQSSTLSQLKDGMLNNLKESEEVVAVQSRFDAVEKMDMIDSVYSNETERKSKEINAGLSTFSMTDLVLSAETLINANVRLSCLLSGHRPPSEGVREIAVITRPEGIRWIKHSYIFE